MPTPTPDEIRDAAATSAATGVASATSGDQSATAMDPAKQLATADKLEAQQQVKAGRSGWAGRAARAELPGAN